MHKHHQHFSLHTTVGTTARDLVAMALAVVALRALTPTSLLCACVCTQIAEYATTHMQRWWARASDMLHMHSTQGSSCLRLLALSSLSPLCHTPHHLLPLPQHCRAAASRRCCTQACSASTTA